jgi:hypothetical protein
VVFDNVGEANLWQRLCDQSRIVGWSFQNGLVRIIRVPNHESNALFGGNGGTG